jgi:hypothetical protein
MPEQQISWKWVVIGGGITIVLNKVLILALSGPLANAVVIGEDGVATGVTTMFWVYLALITIGSYFVGGIATGWLSPGETIKEPAAAAALAVLINSISDYLMQSQNEAFAVGPWLMGAVAMMVLGFGLGLAGGWLGERLQGDTTDKMRERGELPPL